jgi:hypothetical protein
MTPARREELERLFQEYVQTYLLAPEGRKHMADFPKVRQQGCTNYTEVTEATKAGRDITNLVLLKWLPHTDSKIHRDQGAWVHLAPAITGDFKKWFESTKWVKTDAWPKVARLIYDFVTRCYERPSELEEACISFSGDSNSKGLQSGMLSPILNALREDDFLIINNKTRKTLNYFLSSEYKQSLADYPAANSAALSFSKEVIGQLGQQYPELSKLHVGDLFDIFCHWFVGVKKFFDEEEIAPVPDVDEFENGNVGYWKIAPGGKAWQWDECRLGGFIAIGWDELGDLTSVTRKEFERRRAELLAIHPNWTADAVEQVWRFAHIKVGDRIIANRGTTQILGIGTVTGPYFHESNAEMSHRLPVHWDDTKVRSVSEGGWRRTLVKLDEAKFESILNASVGEESAGVGTRATTPRYWVEKCSVDGRPDREAGDHALGKVLWSPQRGSDGRDIYASMLDVQVGDIVFHLTDNQAVTGVSIVAGKIDDAFIGLPDTAWAGRPAYRIPLNNFVALDPPLNRSAFLGNAAYQQRLRGLLEQGHNLFYAKNLDLNQGAYLTEAPRELVDILQDVCRKQTGKNLPYVTHVYVAPGSTPAVPFPAAEPEPQPYSLDDALTGLFIERQSFLDLVALLRAKKNVILEGPPGVGKTFFAKRLAFALLEQKAERRVGMVQFHPSYSYEDFIQGYRPASSGFSLKDGVFYSFCQRARRDPQRNYVFIIDEINRGNLSKVFGELMMLIEADKRGPTWAIPLTYGQGQDDTFFVPENLYLIGLMNTADRSLAMVDYALRRRFAFVGLDPGFNTTAFREFLIQHGASNTLVNKIVQGMTAVNDRIAKDTANLGPGYCIGHSFFCAISDEEVPDNGWYRRIIKTEIEPLLREYWFDDKSQADALVRDILLAD